MRALGWLLIVGLLPGALACGLRTADPNAWETVTFGAAAPTIWHDGERLWVSSTCFFGLQRVEDKGGHLEMVYPPAFAQRKVSMIAACPGHQAQAVGYDSYFYDGLRWIRQHGLVDGTQVVCASKRAYALVPTEPPLLFRQQEGSWRLHWQPPQDGTSPFNHLKSLAEYCQDGRCTLLLGGYGHSLTMDEKGEVAEIEELRGIDVFRLDAFKDQGRTRVFAASSRGTFELDPGADTPSWQPTSRPYPLALSCGRSWSWNARKGELIETSDTGLSRSLGLRLDPAGPYVYREISGALVDRHGWLWVVGSEYTYDPMKGHESNAMACFGTDEVRFFIARRPLEPSFPCERS